MSLCKIEEYNKGGPYPKSCPTCGLAGTCVKGLENLRAKPNSRPEAVDFAKIRVGDRVRLGGKFEIIDVDGLGLYPLAVKVDGRKIDIMLSMVAEHLPVARMPIQEGDQVTWRVGSCRMQGRAGKPLGEWVLVDAGSGGSPALVRVADLQHLLTE